MNTIRAKLLNRREAGFSLVEMAIVLVIIGLIVSAIAVGKTTMAKGEATKTFQQFINPYIQAVLSNYQGTGTTALSAAAQKELLASYKYGDGTIELDAANTKATSSGQLTVAFKLSGLTGDQGGELANVFRNALSGTTLDANGSSTVNASNSLLAATFRVPAVNIGNAPGNAPK
ncbi:MAG: prepilin-type N-terminal cleavage/methylation domain-containing protein [Magnetococcales bacterium]|nr:prepilin-type N-terminal cleavage/methylation domain-containing protein [Magnetococcales bacterium]